MAGGGVGVPSPGAVGGLRRAAKCEGGRGCPTPRGNSQHGMGPVSDECYECRKDVSGVNEKGEDGRSRIRG